MKVARYFFVAIVCLFSTHSFADSELTSASVHNMLDGIQALEETRDADALSEFFTPDAAITIDMPAYMGGRIDLTRNQYIDMVREGWSSGMNSTYEVIDIKVVINDGGQTATVTDTTIESVEMGGLMMESRSDQKMTVVLYNGKPAISNLYGKVEM